MSHERVVYVMSVLAPDRLGIVADAAKTIYELGGNLIATSQTIMQGWFTMLVTASFPEEVTRGQVEGALKGAHDFNVFVHRAEDGLARQITQGEPFIMTAVGEDKPGIVCRLAECCAGRGVNIEDVWNEVRENNFITIFHLTLPPDVDPKYFRYELEQAAEAMGVRLTLQHQDIFTATNSLQVHTRRP